MKHIYLILRSTLIWIVSAVHFFTVCGTILNTFNGLRVCENSHLT